MNLAKVAKAVVAATAAFTATLIGGMAQAAADGHVSGVEWVVLVCTVVGATVAAGLGVWATTNELPDAGGAVLREQLASIRPGLPQQ